MSEFHFDCMIIKCLFAFHFFKEKMIVHTFINMLIWIIHSEAEREREIVMHTLKHESRSNLKLEKSIKKVYCVYSFDIEQRMWASKQATKWMHINNQNILILNNSTHTHRGPKWFNIYIQIEQWLLLLSSSSSSFLVGCYMFFILGSFVVLNIVDVVVLCVFFSFGLN